MILFENHILKLVYTPATDILDAQYPDLHDFLLPEIKHSIEFLIDKVKNYDIKYLLLDTTRTVFSVSPEESREIALYLATGLSKTRIQKLARVKSLNFDVETRAKGTMQYIIDSGMVSYQLKSFPDKAEALEWLKVKQEVSNQE